MKYHHPLKKILSRTRPYWDRNETRPAVRWAFRKALQCRTPELGAEVYGSENQELILYHTCKSRACPSCGYRATAQWQRAWWTALPEALYKGITFTMPRELWPLFHDNPLLAKALPVLAAKLIEVRVSAKHGLRVGVIPVPHSFNGKLEFNSHVHTMVTGGGLYGSSDSWVSRVYYEQDPLMEAWRRAVIALLRAALRADQLCTKMTVEQMEELLTEQENRWSSVKIQSFKSKEHFLRYAGRLRKAAAHRAAAHHLHRGTDRYVLVQRQKAASPGCRTVPTGRVHRALGTTHSGTLSTRGSVFWAICPACSQANLGSRLCNSGTGAKATPQTSPLGEVHQARLRTGSAPRPNRHKDEMGAATTSQGVPLFKI